ncbi:MAG: NAD(P)/FAD-dependent oxidoreductase [Bacteroidales bacterium]|nr:NAD(P)/FAD-dependent oxidoreductase [Bacteroidales bacterium]MBN2698025.1 NAD(P)/FAD-dependent oxidoreductase [Bacteroidales bacterium]
MAEKKYHSVVIGGGMAGLTCAAYLAREGKSVLLIEKNRECGGLVNTFSRDGFQFEAGIRALENAGIIFPMLKELGIELDVVKSPVSVGVENEILHIKDIGSLKEYRNLLKKIYPESEAEIDHLMKIIRKVMKQMDVLYGLENPNFKDLRSDRNYLFKELLPWLPKFLLTIGKINRMNMPVEPYLGKIVTNPSLRDIISQHFFKNTPAFFALSYFSLYLDYFYPRGGVGKLAAAVEKRFLEWGGEIKRETVIERVLACEHRVTDQNDVSYIYENLVWAADLKTFYRITDVAGCSPGVQSKFGETKSRLSEKRGGDSVFTLFVEVDDPPESFRKIANGHFFYSPSKQGLGETHWSELDSILKASGKVEKSRMLNWLDKFLTLNTYEISIPALKDPDLAPEGKTGLIISILAEYDLFKMIDEAGWYREFITEMEERIIRVLAGSVYPMLEDKVMARFSFSPLSYENRVGTSEGAITGWSFREPVPAINKILSSNRAVVTPIPSVFQAGQWTYSPAGVPMAILTGKLAARRILNR